MRAFGPGHRDAHRPVGGPRHRAPLSAAAAILLALPAMPLAAHAQKATPAEGQRIAERYCARCHVVAPGGGAGWTDAPAFATIAQNPRISRTWMRQFVTQQHMHMLDTDRSPAEADALAAYLLSLRREQ